MLSLHLRPNQVFNLTIIAYNSYGNMSFNTSVSKSLCRTSTIELCGINCVCIFTFLYALGTHSVIAVNVGTTWTDLTCIFNAGSYAIGCLINLTNMANGITYCIALQRFSNVSFSAFPMFRLCNLAVNGGRYLLQVYDIERDGEISTLPAIIKEVLLRTFSSMVLEPSVSRMCMAKSQQDML